MDKRIENTPNSTILIPAELTEAFSVRCSNNYSDMIFFDIWSTILASMSKGLLHCDWYGSSFVEDRVDRYINEEKSVIQAIKALEEYGFHCTCKRYVPNNVFITYRLKVHISWEDVDSQLPRS